MRSMRPLDQSYIIPLDPSVLSQYLTFPPFVAVEGAANVRDLGNIPTMARSESHQTRPNRVFRSAQLSSLSLVGRETLARLKITAIFDFRTNLEVVSYNAPMASVPGAEVFHVPVVPEDYLAEAEVQKREAEYELMGDGALLKEYGAFLEYGGVAFGTVFRYLRDHPGAAILVHCAIGKDRTGLFAALLLMLVGVMDDDICHDYSLSRVGLEPPRELILGYMKETPAVVSALMGSKYATMQKTLAIIRRRYGGAEGYLDRKCGLSTEDCEAIRRSFIVAA